jgi:glucosylglycerate phosphorylase
MSDKMRGWESSLHTLYGDRAPIETMARLLSGHRRGRVRAERWDERDAWLIAYPNQVSATGSTPLAALHRVYNRYFSPAFNGIHVLPFFPFSSDEGFSVTDYLAVNPDYGSWQDIGSIARDARLMVDAVINHCSVSSSWFGAWAADAPEYRGYIRTSDPTADLSETVRAREHPLLTPFKTARGEEWVWTTFSADQADLDYRNPSVLLAMVSVLLTYAERGASIIRLDAACFLWKEEGTPSIHLPQTHEIIRVFRQCLDVTYPDVILISETNVPHDQNVSYLGDGTRREADMVYRFTLPPLTLHTFATGNARELRSWIEDTTDVPSGTTYLNFLGSHDGVGLRPLEGLVDMAAVEELVASAERFGGAANRRRQPDGSSSPYELNATWFDLIRGNSDDEDALARHVGSHAIMLSLAGVPAVYIHALLATNNDVALMHETGFARSINRSRFEEAAIEELLGDRTHRAARSLARIGNMLSWRGSTRAFHPDSSQTILDTPDPVFGVERTSADGTRASVFVNVSGNPVTVLQEASNAHGYRVARTGSGFEIGPWGSLWLLPDTPETS